MHITLIQCNDLESNEKFFKRSCQKNSMKKKQIWTKQFFWKFSKFSEVPKFGYFLKIM